MNFPGSQRGPANVVVTARKQRLNLSLSRSRCRHQPTHTHTCPTAPFTAPQVKSCSRLAPQRARVGKVTGSDPGEQGYTCTGTGGITQREKKGGARSESSDIVPKQWLIRKSFFRGLCKHGASWLWRKWLLMVSQKEGIIAFDRASFLLMQVHWHTHTEYESPTNIRKHTQPHIVVRISTLSARR